METLEATVASKPDPIPEHREEKSEGMKRNDKESAEKWHSEVNVENTEAVERLSATCNSLQTQVEQLQSSLQGVITFMSSFNKVNIILFIRFIFSNQFSPSESMRKNSTLFRKKWSHWFVMSIFVGRGPRLSSAGNAHDDATIKHGQRSESDPGSTGIFFPAGAQLMAEGTGNFSPRWRIPARLVNLPAERLYFQNKRCSAHRLGGGEEVHINCIIHMQSHRMERNTYSVSDEKIQLIDIGCTESKQRSVLHSVGTGYMFSIRCCVGHLRKFGSNGDFHNSDAAARGTSRWSDGDPSLHLTRS